MQSNPLSNQNSKQFHKVQENVCKQVAVAFGFTCELLLVLLQIGWESGASFLSESLSKTKVNANYFQPAQEKITLCKKT